jgi:Animal haem peroxidase/F5/8 type C domain
VAGVAAGVALGLPLAPLRAPSPTSPTPDAGTSHLILPVADAHGVPACTTVGSHYGRMFPTLPAATWSRPAVDALTTQVMAGDEAAPTPEGVVDDEENLAIPAGYTYVGQLVDHDLTKDSVGDLSGTLDPATVVNERTPRFDLDSVYGAGPAASPQLYQDDGVHLLTGAPLTGAPSSGTVDHPRDVHGQALLGDPRDDENRLVGSLHAVLVRFHNLEVDRVRQANPRLLPAQVFQRARQQVLWHYQWAVLTDFLPRIVGHAQVSAVLPSLDVARRAPRLSFYDPCTSAMPVEFSVAAYRYGHSQVRSIYRINSAQPRMPVFTPTMDPRQSLVGFQPSPADFAVDWGFFFPMDGTPVTGHPQSSYKIDNSLVFPLGLLPLPAVGGSGPTTLALRNVLRAEQLGVPSGQDVARAMGLTPLADDQILVGKATGDPADAAAITDISPEFAGRAPLWTYVLAEAVSTAYHVSAGKIQGEQQAPLRLGRVGARIVTETFVGLLAADHSSVLYRRGFRPDRAFTHAGQFGFRDLIAAVDGHDLARQRPTQASTGNGAWAVDGDPTTAWTPQQAAGADLLVDLGSTHQIGRIRLQWNGNHPPRGWGLAVGDGAGSWTSIPVPATGGAVTELDGLGVQGRFIRITLARGAFGRTGHTGLAELAAFDRTVMPVDPQA